jgi:hypothetical protein
MWAFIVLIVAFRRVTVIENPRTHPWEVGSYLLRFVWDDY